MNNNLYYVLFIFHLSGFILAQDYSNTIKQMESISGKLPIIYLNEENHIPVYLAGKLSLPSSKDKQEIAYQFLQDYSALFQIHDAKQEFIPKRKFTDELNKTHIHLKQVYKGLEVWGSELIVHLDTDGSVYCIAGKTNPTPVISTFPVVDSLTARSSVSKHFSKDYKVISIGLCIYTRSANPKLAWKTRVVKSPEEDWLVFIDAETGETLFSFNQTPFDGAVICTGKGLNGQDKSFQGYQHGSDFEMIDITKSMFNSGIPGNEKNGNIITKNFINSSVVKSTSTVFSDPAAVDAHVYTADYYNFLESNFDLQSWDGNGRSLISNVHYGTDYNNAFWSNITEQLYYGDGDGKNLSSFAGAKDIVAHEITHGIVYSTSGLIYFDQPGALNESFCDIMAAAYDNDDWLIAEDITLSEPKFMRSFINPNAGFITFPLPFGAQPAHISEYFYAPYDNGGTHYNSGIHNKVMYILSELIGRENAAKIFYRAFTNYLVANSNFIDARFASIQSAIDLNLDTTAVKTAYDEVGISPVYKDASQIYNYDPIAETDISMFATLPTITTSSPNEKLSLHVSPEVSPLHLMTMAFIYGAGQQGREVEISLHVDESGIPGQEIASVKYTIPVNYAFAAIVDLSFLEVAVTGDFHIVLSSPTSGMKVAFVSDKNNNRSLRFNGNSWETLFGCVGIRITGRYQKDVSLETRWATQTLNTPQTIRSFAMYSQDEGWAVGSYGTLLYTNTGGLVWHTIKFDGGEDLLSIDFPDYYNGCIIGGVNIYYTTDSGVNWLTAENPSGNNLKAVKFADNKTGFAVGNYGTVLKSSDGGASWLQQSIQNYNNLYAVDFINENIGWVVGANGAILHTTNGGEEWIEQTSPVTNYFYAVDFIDSETGWIAGSEGIILKTTDGGKNWIQQNSPTDAGLRSIYAIDKQTVYAAGFSGTLIKTLDGNSWQNEQTGVINNFYTIQFVDKSTGWIGGDFGMILNTRPQVTNVESDKDKMTWNLMQNYPNPFNPNTVISYLLPVNSLVTLKIYDVLGREVAVLVNEEKAAGVYEIEFSANSGSAFGGVTSTLASGIYFYQLKAVPVEKDKNEYIKTIKMLLLK